MDIKELENLMISHGLVIRAIPMTTTEICETRHIKLFPHGEIKYLEKYKREMLVINTPTKHGGKFIIQCVRNTMAKVDFNKSKYFDSIEQAVESVVENGF